MTTEQDKLLLTPEEIVVKVWDMALASVSPSANPKGYQIVRTATLEWARDEIKAQLAKALKHRLDRPEKKTAIILAILDSVEYELTHGACIVDKDRVTKEVLALCSDIEEAVI